VPRAGETEYYDILQVPRTATLAEIKRAYKKLAIKVHPDKTKDEAEKKRRTEEFKKIGEAYFVLSDEKKRHTYDNWGKQGLENVKMGAPPNWDGKMPEDDTPTFDFGGMGGQGASFSLGDAQGIFDSFFGGSDPFSMFGGNSGGGGRRHVVIQMGGPGGRLSTWGKGDPTGGRYLLGLLRSAESSNRSWVETRAGSQTFSADREAARGGDPAASALLHAPLLAEISMKWTTM